MNGRIEAGSLLLKTVLVPSIAMLQGSKPAVSDPFAVK